MSCHGSVVSREASPGSIAWRHQPDLRDPPGPPGSQWLPQLRLVARIRGRRTWPVCNGGMSMGGLRRDCAIRPSSRRTAALLSWVGAQRNTRAPFASHNAAALRLAGRGTCWQGKGGCNHFMRAAKQFQPQLHDCRACRCTPSVLCLHGRRHHPSRCRPRPCCDSRLRDWRRALCSGWAPDEIRCSRTTAKHRNVRNIRFKHKKRRENNQAAVRCARQLRG